MSEKEEKLSEIIKGLFGEDTKPEEVRILACKIPDYAGAKEKKENADEDVNIEHVADQLPAWRGSHYWKDKVLLARYGRGSDLDRLMRDPDWRVRCAVAFRKRDKDLDILAKDHDIREQKEEKQS